MENITYTIEELEELYNKVNSNTAKLEDYLKLDKYLQEQQLRNLITERMYELFIYEHKYFFAEIKGTILGTLSAMIRIRKELGK